MTPFLPMHGVKNPTGIAPIERGKKAASMARRNTRTTTRRAAPARARGRTRRTRRKKPFVLRWYHLLVGCIASFCLGYLAAFGHATRYVSTVAGLP